MSFRKIKKKITAFFLEELPSPHFYFNRATFVLVFFLGLYLLLIGRSFWLHVFSDSEKLTPIANQQYQSAIKLPPYRGTIYDRRYVPLAISVKTPSIAINPRVFDPSEEEEKQLSSLLGIEVSKIRETEGKKNYFAWLKRKILPETFDLVKKLDINGLYGVMEPSRYYPQGTHAAHLVGLVGTDDNGLLGLEQSYNKKLKGTANEILRFKDAKGHQIFLNAEAALPQNSGYNLVLTIDSVIQEIAETVLEKWVHESSAKGGFALIADPHTGRILAVANQPGFNPNDPQLIKMQTTNNLAFNMLYEPGSIMKSFVISSALEKGLTNDEEIFNCEKGSFKVDKHLSIHDEHPKELLTTSEILIHSSNIGVYKIAKRLGKKGLYNSLRNFGFGAQVPLLEFPGTSGGQISNPEKWETIRFSNIAFGQGLLVNGLEVIAAYSVFANGGNLIQPHVVERIENEEGEILYSSESINKKKILSPKTVTTMRKILERTVSEAAVRAKTSFYTTAGKTGTTEKVDPVLRTYSETMRIASFVGFAPVTDPYIVAYIVIDEPQKKPYYGAVWAAPAFSEIVSNTLRYLNVAPDKKTSDVGKVLSLKP